MEQLWKQLGVRFFSKWYYTQPGVGILAGEIGCSWTGIASSAMNIVFLMPF